MVSIEYDEIFRRIRCSKAPVRPAGAQLLCLVAFSEDLLDPCNSRKWQMDPTKRFRFECEFVGRTTDCQKPDTAGRQSSSEALPSLSRSETQEASLCKRTTSRPKQYEAQRAFSNPDATVAPFKPGSADAPKNLRRNRQASLNHNLRGG
ncbi:hypothetical protein N2601_30365 (plasmid) [Rhizobium sp. CB3060]|uniref:hypothetical protein n=1 Tax=Rhizobium sp. CB3060 TaxID=3138255 RepID=UPI0021A678AE|nr:hypothetical protein [Rhizobium tropici]UWU25737.1 hypothetical protein N2601_30365 [Rhizobium tropici]